ncbi:MAG TPA: intradiol ring-cleavage dioxygenase [Roseateles sp.]
MLTPTAFQHDGDHHAAPSPRLSRRQVLWGVAGLVGASPAIGEDALRRETAEDALGPFYPLSLPKDQDFDLSLIAGHKTRALGQLLYVSGRVLNPRGEPVPYAVLEIWQANAAGRYTHPGDTSDAPLDPNFQGYARIRSGPDGSYLIKTIQPGNYGPRTRHIHFDVRGKATRLVTQMYFEGEPKNEVDPLLKMQAPEDRKTLFSRPGTPTARQERDALAVSWDIVLAFG